MGGGAVDDAERSEGLTQQLAGRTEEKTWKPALVEIEEALVLAFIIEELDDGRFTVLVPSVPTPFAGSVYVLTPERVHPVDVPFTQAIKVVARWGSGSRDLVAVMEGRKVAPPEDEQSGDVGRLDHPVPA